MPLRRKGELAPSGLIINAGDGRAQQGRGAMPWGGTRRRWSFLTSGLAASVAVAVSVTVTTVAIVVVVLCDLWCCLWCCCRGRRCADRSASKQKFCHCSS